MYIKGIEWIDEESKEAIVEVSNGMSQCLICFSCPCNYNIGDVLREPLECLDTKNVAVCKENRNYIKRIKNTFEYKMNGMLKNIRNGIVDIYGFNIHIDERKIPKDITDGMNICFTTARIDVW